MIVLFYSVLVAYYFNSDNLEGLEIISDQYIIEQHNQADITNGYKINKYLKTNKYYLITANKTGTTH